MADSVTMPALGESVTEGTVTRWLKQVGEQVEVDEPLLEVSTDKVDTEIPSPFAGVLQEILVQEDETVEVGAQLALIGTGADSASGAPAEPEAPAAAPEPEAAPEPAPAPAAQETTATPAAEVAQEEQPASGSDGEGTPVLMPALGESVTEGTVTRWLKAEGDTVEVDEPLLEVSTDKVDTEIPSPVAGTVQKILVQEDETVEVGAQLALVGSGSATAAAPQQEAPKAEAPKAEAPKAPEPTAPEAEAPKAPQPAAAKADAPKAEAPKAEAPKAEQPAAEVTATEDGARDDYNSVAPQTGGAVTPPVGEATSSPAGSTADVSSYVTPLVRKLAAQHDVDLASVTGTGVGGRIRKQDVLDAAEAAEKAKAAAAAPAAAPAAPASQAPAAGGSGVAAKRGTTEKMTRLRKVIASRMVESLQVSAQLTTVVEVDVTRIARLRATAKDDFRAREGVGLSFLPFFALAAIEGLKVYPQVNASLEGDSIVYHAQENLGVAVDTERGLLVPVIKDAGDLNIAGLARKIADLAARTRDNKVTPDELGGGTFTLTNTGSRGALFDTPIINQPQVAILGTGAVVKRPVVVPAVDGGETIAIRSMVYLALSYDHRLVDGADAARFLTTMKQRLEEGAFEADLGL